LYTKICKSKEYMIVVLINTRVKQIMEMVNYEIRMECCHGKIDSLVTRTVNVWYAY